VFLVRSSHCFLHTPIVTYPIRQITPYLPFYGLMFCSFNRLIYHILLEYRCQVYIIFPKKI
jgi:hypothetical protein